MRGMDGDGSTGDGRAGESLRDFLTGGMARRASVAVSTRRTEPSASEDQKSLARNILDGIADAYPGGVRQMVADMAADPKQRPKLVPLINKCLSLREGEGSDTNAFDFRVYMGDEPVVEVDGGELKDRMERKKLQAHKRK